MEENKKIVANKEKKPRKTSVYMLLNIILVAGILLFSGVILYTVYSNLQNGLVKYFEEEVADDAVSIIGYIDDEHKFHKICIFYWQKSIFMIK